jgi:hypothetical protein
MPSSLPLPSTMPLPSLTQIDDAILAWRAGVIAAELGGSDAEVVAVHPTLDPITGLPSGWTVFSPEPLCSFPLCVLISHMWASPFSNM